LGLAKSRPGVALPPATRTVTVTMPTEYGLRKTSKWAVQCASR
jgi:hypothetical protein